MKIVTITMELGIDNMDDEIDFSNKEEIAEFLNNMLYEDAEFFGDFGPENILEVRAVDD
jgi:hypothetical protein